MGRIFGSPLAGGGGGMVWVVFLLAGAQTAMNASRAASRVNSAIWLVANWVIATFSGLTPDSVRITRSKVTLAWVRPMTPTRCPARSSIPLIFGAGDFLEPLGGRPEGAQRTTTFLRRMATDSALAGSGRS